MVEDLLVKAPKSPEVLIEDRSCKILPDDLVDGEQRLGQM
jgi:hypothetical protein